MANETVYRELIGCTKEVLITNRAPAGECVIEAPALDDKNYFNIANSNTTGTATLLHGTAAGNRVTLTAPKIDITNPSYTDQDGIQMLNIPYVAIPSDAGNDEMKLVFA